MSRTVKLIEKGLIQSHPKWLSTCIHYEAWMGSIAYGVNDDSSDIDIYGFAIPPRHYIFPHEQGYIRGFDKNIPNFEQFQKHHVKDINSNKKYDITIYGIVRYFQFLMQGNPNIIDSLFVPDRCVLHITSIGQHLRENRKLFLHKGCFHRFKGYAYSQMNKIKTRNPTGKRKEDVEKYGFDIKYAYHLVRLLNEIEQILIEGDLDVQRNREQLKAIRRGGMSLEEIESYFSKKEQDLESLYASSHLQNKPDYKKIKKLLLECLEMHYGNLDSVIHVPDKAELALQEIRGIIDNTL